MSNKSIVSRAIVVAPLSRAGSEIAALGAAKKICLVARALRSAGAAVVLINTAHNGRGRLKWWKSKVLYYGLSRLGLVSELPEFYSRPVGRLLYIVCSLPIAFFAAFRVRTASLVWIYNAGAPEVLIGLFVACMLRTKVVFEIEDMPSARTAKTSALKVKLDQIAFLLAEHFSDRIYCINENVALHITDRRGRVRILPGLFSAELGSASHAPWTARCHIGYFGGLSVEKGADIVLKILEHGLLPGIPFVVCGSGPLSERFRRLARENVTVCINASDGDVESWMVKCRIILNPHSSIKDMGNGVFPFKVVESIAAGACVISTPLPAIGIDLSGGIVTVSGSEDSFVTAIYSVLNGSEEATERLSAARLAISQNCSESSLVHDIDLFRYSAQDGAGVAVEFLTRET